MRFLVTGIAGFIGFHLTRRLLADGHVVQGVDGMTPYYDVELKKARQGILAKSNRFTTHTLMLEDEARLTAVVAEAKPDVIVHLAAQAGVRYSLENPRAYVGSNLVGTFNLLELARRHKPRHFIFGSTSSVYGAGEEVPFKETSDSDHPLSLYAATKKSGELMLHSYAHLFDVPTTVIRFFTVYGPWGRPDMALFKFVDAILADRAIDVYGDGKMSRDFTYIDDLIEAIVRLVPLAPARESAHLTDEPDSLSPVAPFRVVNVGRGQPVDLLDFIVAIEKKLGSKAKKNMLPMQPGDVPATFASANLLQRLTGYRPATTIEDGVGAFIDWYKEYYRR
ncbi:MAG TPA: NAD-dependent epimerase/dehydratase family protein [Xanthobacteraceae bacterium]|nr:NAD-dependent epimerase/dehydratase family protein [Xanthobacteraceae bacterium]